MNKQQFLKFATHIIFFGALWGLLEATLGFFLHMIPVPFIAGSVMFPIAMVLLITAYKRVPNRQTLLYIALVAAAIKSVNLLSPLPHFSVINPMIAMIVQSLVVFGTIGFLSKKPHPTMITAILITTLAWRVIFIAWQSLLIASPIVFFSPHLASLQAFSNFVIIEGALSAVIGIAFVSALHYLAPHNKIRVALKPFYALSILMVAITLSYLL